ncbi:hypothetical protein F2Q69_00007517 [Brassica cretica]|uniref:Uncharacterized protein n=1 Tax=Brassica cretica TaxID=69181 RepID=A0A8S9PGL1_BRACR|nr:hypothetical protein F2Q69_00007517 [Brassica cretica]
MAENMKWVRYGLRETASKGRRECMDSCRINVSEELGHYVATEWNARSFRPRGTDARSLRSDRAGRVLGRYVATGRDGRSTEWDVCSVATWRTSLTRAWSLRSDRPTFFGLFSDVSCFFRSALLCKLAGFLKTLEYWQRDKFWDLVSRFLILCLEMLETSALGLGQDLGLLLVLEGAMTNSTYVSRFSFILIPYRFKVRDSRQVIGAVVAQFFWLCMKDVLSFIAKDVVAKGLDDDAFVLSIRSSRLESSLKGMLKPSSASKERCNWVSDEWRLSRLISRVCPWWFSEGDKA